MTVSSDSPSPWEVTNDFLKTVITLGAAILAFTGTFASKWIESEGRGGRLLFCSWLFLLGSIALALFSAARLASYLNGVGSERVVLFFANMSYFSLFIGAALFFGATLEQQRAAKPSQPAFYSELLARRFLTTLDTAVTNPTILSISKSGRHAAEWEVSYTSGIDTLHLIVNTDLSKILRFDRR